MNAKNRYGSRANDYVRYRWEYAPEAVTAIVRIAGIKSDSVVADIGAGTGKLSRHFIGRVRRVYAIEPDPAMRRQAELVFSGCPDCVVLDGTAEDIPLPVESVDLITVAQAVELFDPDLARQEFRRILKPMGWLALVRNYGTDPVLNQETARLMRTWRVNNVQTDNPPFEETAKRYFGGAYYQRLTFPFAFQQDWVGFLGALMETVDMLDETALDFPAFSQAVKDVFERYSVGGKITVIGETEVLIGRPVLQP